MTGKTNKLKQAIKDCYSSHDKELIVEEEDNSQNNTESVTEYKDVLISIKQKLCNYSQDNLLPMCEHLSVESIEKFISSLQI